MFKARRLSIVGFALCLATIGFALVPAFSPKAIPSLGIALPDQGSSLYGACTGTAFLFVFCGVIISFIAGDIASVSDFVHFLYAAAFFIIGKCKGYNATGLFPAVLIIVGNVAECFTFLACLKWLSGFFRLVSAGFGDEFFSKAIYVPFIILVLKIILIATGAIKFWASSLDFINNALFWLLSATTICLLIYFLRRIPRQSSLSMRVIFFSFCISFMPFMCNTAVLSTESMLKTGSIFLQYWSPIDIFCLLIIPVGFLCATLQTVKESSDQIVTKIMAAFFTLVLTGCIYIFVPSTINGILLFVICPPLYQILCVPLDKFLHPKMTAVEHSLDSLERTTFRCSNPKRIYEVVSDWIIAMLNPEFVAFYEKPVTDKKKGKFLFTEFRHRKENRAVLDVMVADRLNHPSRDGERFIHRKEGFSVPMYQMHNLNGFIFVGAKSEDEMFSNAEMALMKPVTRILMESLMVLNLRNQANYVSEMQNQIVFSFADMIESRDGTTGQHIKRTSTIVSLLAKNLREHNLYADKLLPADYDMIALAAPLHDIGKIKVPDSILSKPGKLTEVEFDTIKTHPVEGEKIINRTMSHIENERYLKLAREMALYHHEKWNGKGYPSGLAGEAIPVSARIMAIADVFDALCSARSYKEAYTVSQAFSILEESRGSHFEPCLVDAMKVIKPELERIYMEP
ncbi:MAG: HD domain-containing protein [Treponema sp.]|nr:HD domain-containing protein [Candidatus Treponema caballi]